MTTSKELGLVRVLGLVREWSAPRQTIRTAEAGRVLGLGLEWSVSHSRIRGGAVLSADARGSRDRASDRPRTGSSSHRGPRLVLPWLAAAGLLAPTAATAQSLAARVAAAPDGTVRMSFAARPGVCGNGRNISTQRSTADWESDCDTGPVRVVLSVHDGAVTRVRTYVGGRWRPGGATVTDLGTVPAPAAAAYLVALAADAGDDVARKAILPATLADSAVIWPELLDIARDRSRPREARRAAVFWLGQEAGRAVAGPLEALATDRNDDRSVREHAVFALSQLPRDEGVPALIRIARTHDDPGVRKKALFWLAQSEDPRALALFEEILVKH